MNQRKAENWMWPPDPKNVCEKRKIISLNGSFLLKCSETVTSYILNIKTVGCGINFNANP